jgi:nitroreductase
LPVNKGKAVETGTVDSVLEPIRRRWSPRAFSEKPVERTKLANLFEAARWAASSANEQPWRFILATKGEPDAFGEALLCLRERNRNWAQYAPVIAFSLARTSYSNSGGVNRYAWHDVGLAVASLSIQAASEGLQVHQIGGFYPENVRTTYRVPEEYEPVSGLVIGYPGPPHRLPPDLQEKEHRERVRKPLEDLVFSGSYGTPADLSGKETNR